ncbi:hypothetical protein [Streptomyces sp. G-G2]|uniref:hypothetical protein n=1 Tax=Streptomyces sp. G-G2 TaxID=3046201 RepID=UPI0024B90DC1|nr:hypothetical protein [Streptomyces sp. G-G2]MDJ0381221.1 hypothetical protein [Streptomyces sp. G-G2]
MSDPDDRTQPLQPLQPLQRPGPEEPPGSAGPPAAPEEDGYSATVLGSHWISGPPEHPEHPERPERPERPDGLAATRRIAAPGGPEGPEAVPDRVEGSVLRFGPGVTAGVAAPFPVTAPPPAAVAARGRRGAGLRRYALALVVLAAVLAYLGWQRYGPAVAVRDVRVSTDARGPGCDSTADVVAVVRTNGNPGTIRYRWVRGDGSRSDVLSERVPRGEREARLHLLWTFRGTGDYPARAEIRIEEPGAHTAAVEFSYRCPR